MTRAHATFLTRLSLSLALAAALLGGGTTTVLAKELTLASPLPPSHRFTPALFTAFAERLKQASGGKMTVKLYTGGSLNPSLPKQYSMLLDGVADIAFVIPIYTADIFPVAKHRQRARRLRRRGGLHQGAVARLPADRA